MTDYLNEYFTNTEYNYLMSKIDDKIKELLVLNKDNIINNIEYLKNLDLNLFDIFSNRVDLIICNNEELVSRIDKVKNIINKLEVLDYILFGI